MTENIRYPSINTASSDREQLMQIRRYLYQLVDQVNFNLSVIDSGGSKGYTLTDKDKAEIAQQVIKELTNNT